MSDGSYRNGCCLYFAAGRFLSYLIAYKDSSGGEMWPSLWFRDGTCGSAPSLCAIEQVVYDALLACRDHWGKYRGSEDNPASAGFEHFFASVATQIGAQSTYGASLRASSISVRCLPNRIDVRHSKRSGNGRVEIALHAEAVKDFPGSADATLRRLAKKFAPLIRPIAAAAPVARKGGTSRASAEVVATAPGRSDSRHVKSTVARGITVGASKRVWRDLSFDWDRAIPLDAEELAEGGMEEAYARIAKEFRKLGVGLAPVQSLSDAEGYAIACGGRTIQVYRERDVAKGGLQGMATVALFDLVNGQLCDQPFRLWALLGGNDLCGIILSEDEAIKARKKLPRKQDWPYLPRLGDAWLGMHH